MGLYDVRMVYCNGSFDVVRSFDSIDDANAFAQKSEESDTYRNSNTEFDVVKTHKSFRQCNLIQGKRIRNWVLGHTYRGFYIVRNAEYRHLWDWGTDKFGGYDYYIRSKADCEECIDQYLAKHPEEEVFGIEEQRINAWGEGQ